MRTFVVTAERTPRGWWVLEAPEVGAVSQVRRLERAPEEMREAIAHLAGIAEDEVAIRVEPVLPEEFTAAVEAAEQARAALEAAQASLSANLRVAARSLAGRGVTVRDIGQLMSITPQRASQLVNS